MSEKVCISSANLLGINAAAIFLSGNLPDQLTILRQTYLYSDYGAESDFNIMSFAIILFIFELQVRV
jgi:hypothetical protein